MTAGLYSPPRNFHMLSDSLGVTVAPVLAARKYGEGINLLGLLQLRRVERVHIRLSMVIHSSGQFISGTAMVTVQADSGLHSLTCKWRLAKSYIYIYIFVFWSPVRF